MIFLKKSNKNIFISDNRWFDCYFAGIFMIYLFPTFTVIMQFSRRNKRERFASEMVLRKFMIRLMKKVSIFLSTYLYNSIGWCKQFTCTSLRKRKFLKELAIQKPLNASHCLLFFLFNTRRYILLKISGQIR